MTTLLYLVFVVYGSLVPLEFHAVPMHEAWARFADIPWLDLGVGSRADWMANLILYIPLGYLLMNWLGRQGGSMLGKGVRAAIVWITIAGIALAVEFSQLFFPPRTVSLNDLLAEVLGGLAGIMLWLLAGRSLSGIWRRFAAGGPGALRAVMIAYVLLYLFLSLFPYDFLLNHQEWRAHLDSSRVGWLVAGHCGFGCVAKLLAEAIAAVPFGLLLSSRSSRYPLSAALALGLALGMTIEVMQLAIASGVSQGASAVARLIGVMVGAWLPFGCRKLDFRGAYSWLRPGLLLLAFPYTAGLAWLNRWFSGSWTGLDEAVAKLSSVRLVPFYYHYYTAEAVALVSALFQFALYAPIGVGVWLWHREPARRVRGVGYPLGLAAIASSAIELGKLFVVGQRPDPTNLIIAAFAAAGSYGLLTWLFTKPDSQAGFNSVVNVAQQPEVPRRDKGGREVTNPNSLFAMGLLAAALFSLIGHPLGWLPVVLLLALAAICLRWPGSWLAVVPAALPLLDFSYLSGRFFWSEFDSLLLLILAIAYWHKRDALSTSWPGRSPLAVYVISASVALAAGLFPLPPLDFNAFTQYTSPYHALRAFKGLAFALAFLPLINAAWHRDPQQFRSRLAWGMSLGLAAELLYVLWERATFPGLFNFETGYRITGSFPGMHTGGASIEAYLVLAAPFVWIWAWQRKHRLLAMSIAGVLYALAAYAVMVTFSRGGQIAFAVSAAFLLAAFSWLAWKDRRQRVSGILALLVAFVIAALVAWPAVSGKFSQARFATIEADLGTRIAHWKDAIEILPQAGSLLLGAGAGTFPAAFYWYSSAPARPASYGFAREGDNVFLRLGGGESLYFEQQVAVQPGRSHRLQLDVRTSAESAALTVPLCEKAMLYSFTCAWHTVKFSSPDGRWRHHEILLDTGGLGPPGSRLQRPVKLSMFNQDKAVTVDVDNVALLDEDGRDLIRNGDFTDGMTRWFFSTDSHLAWHVKNIFVHVLCEQGWIGLAAFVLLLASAGLTLQRRAGHDPLALVLLVSLSSFLVVGLVDSLIDEPRLHFLFFWLLGIALLSGGELSKRRRTFGSERSPRRARRDLAQDKQ